MWRDRDLDQFIATRESLQDGRIEIAPRSGQPMATLAVLDIEHNRAPKNPRSIQAGSILFRKSSRFGGDANVAAAWKARSNPMLGRDPAQKATDKQGVLRFLSSLDRLHA
jgi:hypothetical protein